MALARETSWKQAKLGCPTRRRLEGVIPDRPGDSHSYVNDGHPALQAMVPRSMEEIRNSNGRGRACEFNSYEERLVIDNGIGQQPLIVSLIAEMARGSVIEHPGSTDSRKEAGVLLVPETVRRSPSVEVYTLQRSVPCFILRSAILRV